MTFDAFSMPALPQPIGGGIKKAPGTGVSALSSDRPVRSGNQERSFVATLKRASGCKGLHHTQSTAHADRKANPAQPTAEAAGPQKRRKVADQEPASEQTAEAKGSAPAQGSAPGAVQPATAENDGHLLNLSPTKDGTPIIEAESDSDMASTISFLEQLAALLLSEEQQMLKAGVGIGPFEQLQSQILPEANRLDLFKQIAAGIIRHQVATGPSGPHADARILELWHSQTATPTAEGSPAGRTEAFAARVAELVDYLAKQHENDFAALGKEAASRAAAVPKAAAHMAAGPVDEKLVLDKMAAAAQPAGADPFEAAKPDTAGKDGRWPWWASRGANAETVSEPHLRQGAENSQASRVLAALKAGGQPVNPNLAAEGVPARPPADASGIKSFVFQNGMLSADQSGGKILQIDGDAKDGSFLTSQEQLPEHLTKLEHAARSAQAAQRSLPPQTLNQIVQKAVLLQHNGQNTVQIDLKPDFLGQIRMQIVTESQQVAIKIVAELPFVKDMLESHLNQLKAELQAQGLNVDELEVSVAHDSRADDDQQQKAAETRRARAPKNGPLSVDAAAGEQTDLPAGRTEATAQSAIDYFA